LKLLDLPAHLEWPIQSTPGQGDGGFGHRQVIGLQEAGSLEVLFLRRPHPHQGAGQPVYVLPGQRNAAGQQLACGEQVR